ncbi:flagellar biosynthesis protein FlhF [Thalassobacillus sp. CUG 92003]|uniref:flagellar biosynthesis protein FlhF n=1 Tax=Thalassobacillus sp. CUG 92003 TaxID=2736641 RepID=UPI0015E7CEAB|nr:flagellar biosynthesis protein FlhF [Thalassobacillus sp. CUG 92003]
MKVKKFEADTMPEVMQKVRKDLGTDAVILNSKEVKKGHFLGLFKKKSIEVIAALDPDELKQGSASFNQSKPVPSPTPSSSTPLNLGDNDGHNEAYETSRDADLMKEIKELKSLIGEQSAPSRYGEELDTWRKYLVEQGIAQDIATRIIEAVNDNRAHFDYEDIPSLLKSAMKNEMPDASFGPLDFQKKYVHLVGPTGVGKTTTLAKIAGEAVLNHRKKVALITTDTYRIAAIDQLQTYAKILDIPLKVAYNLEDYRKAKEAFNSYDLVLVDTAGRNFRDAHYIQELKDAIEFSHDTETYLVMALTAKSQDMTAIFQQFNEVPIERFIFTKADETASYGAAFNLVVTHSKGIAYMTSGQNVPDDIEPGSKVQLVKQIVGEDDGR